MHPWMKPSFSWKRIAVAITVSMFVQLFIAKLQLMQLEEEMDQTRQLLANAERLCQNPYAKSS